MLRGRLHPLQRGLHVGRQDEGNDGCLEVDAQRFRDGAGEHGIAGRTLEVREQRWRSGPALTRHAFVNEGVARTIGSATSSSRSAVAWTQSGRPSPS